MKDIEKRLRSERPEARHELVATLAARTREDARPRRSGAFRLAFAGGLSVVMLVALAAVGGASYASRSLIGAAQQLERLVSPSSAQQAIVIQGLSAGGDQYRPGFGFGDENHNHTGPPGLQRAGGALAPPLRATPNRADRRFLRVATTINLDEQAHLTFSVQTADGTELLISQRRSTVGGGLSGPQTKNVQYSVLIPRSGIPVQLSIPRNLLIPGRTYFIVIQAMDPQGNKTTLRIPFRR